MLEKQLKMKQKNFLLLLGMLLAALSASLLGSILAGKRVILSKILSKWT